MGVDVADRHDLHLLEAEGLPQIAHSHAADPDAADQNLLTRRLGPEYG